MSKKTSDRKSETGSSKLFENRPAEISDFSVTEIPSFIIFWSLAAIVFSQFFTRYVLNDSLAWTEEIARYVLILLAFSGAITVTRKGSHIFLEFFYRYIPERMGKVLSILVESLSMLFYGYMAYLGVELALRTKTKMASAEIPKSLLYWAVAACLALMTFYSAVWVLKKIRQTPSEIFKDIEDHTIGE